MILPTQQHWLLSWKEYWLFTVTTCRFPTAPSLGEEEGESSGSGLYPSLHEQATMPRLNMMVKSVIIMMIIIIMMSMSMITVTTEIRSLPLVV